MPLLDISTFTFTRKAQILLLVTQTMTLIWIKGVRHLGVVRWLGWGTELHVTGQWPASHISVHQWAIVYCHMTLRKAKGMNFFSTGDAWDIKLPKEDTWREFLLSAFPSPLGIRHCHLIAQDKSRLHASGYPNFWCCEVSLALADTGKHHSYPGLDEEAEHPCYERSR